MGKLRTCDRRCHAAKKPACVCWCGGKFHGAQAEAARREIQKRFGILPRQSQEYESMLKGEWLF